MASQQTAQSAQSFHHRQQHHTWMALQLWLPVTKLEVKEMMQMHPVVDVQVFSALPTTDKLSSV